MSTLDVSAELVEEDKHRNSVDPGTAVYLGYTHSPLTTKHSAVKLLCLSKQCTQQPQSSIFTSTPH